MAELDEGYNFTSCFLWPESMRFPVVIVAKAYGPEYKSGEIILAVILSSAIVQSFILLRKVVEINIIQYSKT